MKDSKYRIIFVSVMIIGMCCSSVVLPTPLFAAHRISNEVRLDSNSDQQDSTVSVDKPRITSMDKKGNIFAIWRRETDVVGSNTAYRIHFNRSTNNGRTWLEQDVQVSVDDPRPQGEGAKAMDFAMCHDNRGNIYVLWTTTDRLFHFRHSADHGKTWSDRITLNGYFDLLSDHNKAPKIACDNRGKIYIVWVAWDGYMHFNYSTNRGTTWLEQSIALGPQHAVNNPQIDCNERGRVFISWVDDRDIAIPADSILHDTTIRALSVQIRPRIFLGNTKGIRKRK